MRRRGSLQTRLVAVGAERSRVTEQLAVVEAQLRHVGDAAADAQTRALVAATPLAAREHRIAASDEQRLRREREELVARLARLDQEQNGLLDRFLQERR